MKIYFCVTILSLLSVIGLTIETLVRQTEEDFTISLIQLVGVGKKHTHCALKHSSAKVGTKECNEHRGRIAHLPQTSGLGQHKQTTRKLIQEVGFNLLNLPFLKTKG